MKKIFKRIGYVFLRLFYGKDILSCKWFQKYSIGYLWALKSVPNRIKRKDIKVPYSKKAIIFSGGENLNVASSSINCLQTDIYLQNRVNRVTIGENCYISEHVGIITEQHDVYDLEKHTPGKDVTIGNWVWIGMNSVIMPGVVLGDHTTVGANSVVTKSFPDGYCVIAGVPAKVIRKLDREDFKENLD